MSKATTLWNEEKSKNVVTFAESQAAQTAAAQVLTILKEFYAKAAEATAPLQQQSEAPEISDKPYTVMESGNWF